MPDELLAFRPTPDVWTFSQQLTHIADGNLLIAAPLRGDNVVYVGDPRQLDRPALEKHLKNSFDYVAGAFEQLTSETAAEEKAAFFDDRLSKRGVCYRLHGS